MFIDIVFEQSVSYIRPPFNAIITVNINYKMTNDKTNAKKTITAQREYIQ